jgi:5'-nucleotidase
LTNDDPDPEIVFCDPCRQPLPLRYAADEDHFRYEGDYQSRPADPGADVDRCFGGAITVSLVPL